MSCSQPALLHQQQQQCLLLSRQLRLCQVLQHQLGMLLGQTNHLQQQEPLGTNQEHAGQQGA
jgi:hypothetical protein